MELIEKQKNYVFVLKSLFAGGMFVDLNIIILRGSYKL